MSTDNQILFERIDSYITGKMSAKEVRAFESELKANPDLRTEVEVQKDLQSSIEIGGLAATLEDIHKNHYGANRRMGAKRWMGLAAALAAFISLTYWFTSYQPQTEKLFSEYATQEPGMPVPMSATSQYDFYDAMVDYKTEKYELAIQKWSALLAVEPHNDTLLYFTASAHFNLTEYESAKQLYSKIENTPSSAYLNKAQWYTVLCDLKTNNIPSILDVRPYSNSPYSDRILAIQENLIE